MPHSFKAHPSQLNLKAVYCFVCHLDLTHHRDTEIYWSLDPNGQSRLVKEEICRLGLDHVMTSVKAQCYSSLTDLQLNAIKAFHQVCGYGGEDGEASPFIGHPEDTVCCSKVIKWQLVSIRDE